MEKIYLKLDDMGMEPGKISEALKKLKDRQRSLNS